MKKTPALFAIVMASTLITSCTKNRENDVVSQRYIHKYGYAVSKEEWEARQYPGQVVTTTREGVTITTSYENGVKHGPSTQTYPDSQIIQTYNFYNQGELVKEVSYDDKGMPIREEVQLSPSRRSITLWYAEGTPMSIEEYANKELLQGEYFTLNNDVEARVEKGIGLRIRRDQMGVLLSKDQFDSGYLTKTETFFANGAPESIAHYSVGNLDGEKSVFAQTGEPISCEQYEAGVLHGVSIYFKNGTKNQSISYHKGRKHGSEIHYLDGDAISQELHWFNDRKHGTTTFYIDGSPQSEWYYDGEQVSQKKFEELNRLDEMISRISRPQAQPVR